RLLRYRALRPFDDPEILAGDLRTDVEVGGRDDHRARWHARAALRQLLHVVVGADGEHAPGAERQHQHDEDTDSTHSHRPYSLRISACALMVNAAPTVELVTTSFATGFSTMKLNG